jgi:hypothetical protein
MAPGSTVEVERDEAAEDGGVKISVIKPRKREAVGVGAKGGDDKPELEGGDERPEEPSGELPEEPEVLPDVPDVPPPPEGEGEKPE